MEVNRSKDWRARARQASRPRAKQREASSPSIIDPTCTLEVFSTKDKTSPVHYFTLSPPSESIYVHNMHGMYRYALTQGRVTT